MNFSEMWGEVLHTVNYQSKLSECRSDGLLCTGSCSWSVSNYWRWQEREYLLRLQGMRTGVLLWKFGHQNVKV